MLARFGVPTMPPLSPPLTVIVGLPSMTGCHAVVASVARLPLPPAPL